MEEMEQRYQQQAKDCAKDWANERKRLEWERSRAYSARDWKQQAIENVYGKQRDQLAQCGLDPDTYLKPKQSR